MSQTLDYRRSGAVELSQLSLAEALRTRERAHQACAWTMLAFGIPAALVAPLLIASFVIGLQSRITSTPVIGWWAAFAAALLVIVPSLFWCEGRTKGRWLEEELRAQGTTLGDLWQCSSRGEWELRTTAAGWAGMFELLLWGPRMVMAVWERLRGTVPAAVLNDATAILNYLRHFDGGIAALELPVARPAAALHYLISRDWVGISSTGQRVWLLSEARRQLGFEG